MVQEQAREKPGAGLWRGGLQPGKGVNLLNAHSKPAPPQTIYHHRIHTFAPIDKDQSRVSWQARHSAHSSQQQGSVARTQINNATGNRPPRRLIQAGSDPSRVAHPGVDALQVPVGTHRVRVIPGQVIQEFR
jgi:hypothetical protein